MRFLTAGESHGHKLTVIVDGYPGGVVLDPSFFIRELKRRKAGYGRGKRMEIEDDSLVFTSGVRFSQTIGSPVAMEIENRDFKNWIAVMEPFAAYSDEKAVFKPRPGHADLSGILKYGRKDIRDILERASARETASRVAVGALCKTLLRYFGIDIYSVVWEVGGAGVSWEDGLTSILTHTTNIAALHKKAEKNDLRMSLDNRDAVYKRIDRAGEDGDSLGGVFTVAARGVPPGLGSHIQYDTRLDGILSSLIMGVPAVKAVSLGGGMFASDRSGVNFHDGIYYDKKRGVKRKTNFAGGIEGGMTNGEDIVFTCFMKPIPTLLSPLPSFDIKSLKQTKAVYERSDLTAVPACSVVAEAMLAFGAADAFLKKFGGDSLIEIEKNYRSYLSAIAKIWKKSS